MEDITLRDTLKLAVQTEKIAAKLYDRFARKFAGQGEIAEIFTKLAADEAEHESDFQALLDKTPKENQESAKYEQGSFLRAAAISKFFKQGAFEDIVAVETADEALERALEFEKSTLLFYTAIRDELGPDPALDELIAAEKNHVIALTRVLVSQAKFRGLADPW